MSIVVPLAALLAWELAARAALVSPRYFPPPTATAAALLRLAVDGDLTGELLVTLTRLVFAFLLAAAAGVPLGLLMGMLRPLRVALEPYLATLYPIPKIALLPLLLILIGVGEGAFIATAAITAFFQIVISTMGGVQTVDPRLLEVGRNYGARGVSLFTKIVLPAAMPAVFTGLRLGLGLALISIVAVEFIAAKSGLGHLVFRYWQMLAAPEMFAAFAVIGALGLAVTRGLRLWQTRALAWSDGSSPL
jgi:NitT/TauT family transport system permease protein